MELISVGIRRSNFGFSRVKKIKHSRATVHFFEEESIQKNKFKPAFIIFMSLRDVELISVGIRRSNFGFSRVKKIKHSRATVHFFEEESIQKNKSKPGIYYFHVALHFIGHTIVLHHNTH